MSRVLAQLGGHGTKVLFVGVFLGLLLPDLAKLARPLLAPSVVALLLATLLRVEWQAMLSYTRRPLLGLGITAWVLVASPVIVWLVLKLPTAPEALATALVLMAAAPPILAGGSIAVLLGLDAALAVVACLAGTLLAPFTLPPLALWLLGLQLDVGVAELTLRLAAVVAGAFVGAALIRHLLGPARLAASARQIDGVIVIVMLVFAVAIMDGVTHTLLARPGVVLLWLFAAFVANPALQLLGWVAFSWLGRRVALTIGLLTGNCNMGLLLAALPADADYDVTLFFAIAQLPMYMLPAMILPFYRKLLAGQ